MCVPLYLNRFNIPQFTRTNEIVNGHLTPGRVCVKRRYPGLQGERKVTKGGGSVKAEGLGDGPTHEKVAIAKLRLTLPPDFAIALRS